jgi:hypothetical protein
MTARRRDLIRGPSQEPLAQRLYQALAGHFAERLGCCPLHGTGLICPMCDLTWEGTAADEAEIEGLAEQSLLTGDLVTSPWRCHRCRAEAMCPDCYDTGLDHQALARLSPEEQARFQELLVDLVPQSEPGEHLMR